MALITSISGIRGTIGGRSGQSLTPDDIVKFTAAYGQWIKSANKSPKILIGRDARLSGELVKNVICGTLSAMGITVIDLGLSTTPTVEITVPDENAGGGIIITASHNPKNWNALKLLNEKGEFISAEEGNQILEIANSSDYEYANVDKLGSTFNNTTSLQKHIDKILALPLVDVEAISKADFKIVIDCVNSSGGIAIPKLLNALGVTQLIELFCAPNGRFPHNPEPLEENLSTLANEVRFHNASLGIAVDPDVDRLAFINEDGSYFGEEYTLVSVADYVLQNQKGNTVSNLSSTRALKEITEKYQGSYFPSAVGEVNVVQKMKEVNAIIGGEGNGGVIYPDLHYGRDALVGIALFLSYLAKSGKKISQLRAGYPNYHISKNKAQLDENIDLNNVLDKVKEKYKQHQIIAIDGVKIDFEGDWVHLRKSNTEPVIRIYAESQTETMAENLANKIMDDIKTFIH